MTAQTRTVQEERSDLMAFLRLAEGAGPTETEGQRVLIRNRQLKVMHLEKKEREGLRKAVAQLLGVEESVVDVYPDGSGDVSLTSSGANITFDLLLELSKLLGTRKINIEANEEGAGGCSESNPGSPANASICWYPEGEEESS